PSAREGLLRDGGEVPQRIEGLVISVAVIGVGSVRRGDVTVPAALCRLREILGDGHCEAPLRNRDGTSGGQRVVRGEREELLERGRGGELVEERDGGGEAPGLEARAA